MKCNVCGKRFRLKKENKYEVKEINILREIANPGVVSEAFDCPRCGCQNIVNERRKDYDECGNV
jgi:DNA-directed RNA polymerase subunit RPC12/RpoP